MPVLKAGTQPLGDLADFLVPFAGLVRRSESRHALERYTTGLLADTADKTAAALGRVVPATTGQQLQELLTRTAWDTAAMDRLRIATMVERASVGNGVVIIDDTGFTKKGTHSVGVARQYSGTLGRVDNCQVLVTAHYVDRVFDWPITAQLYLPDEWSTDAARCAVAQVPSTIGGQTKGAIALDLLDVARAADVPATAVVSDAGYGAQPTFLDGLETRRLAYVVAVPSSTHFRRAVDVAADPGDVLVPYHGRGRPRKGPSFAARPPGTEAAALLAAVAPQAWKTVAWCTGTKGALVKQCARVRVYRTGHRGQPHASHGWLLGERPLPGHTGDAKYYYAWNLDGRTLGDLRELMHVRWVVERFYQDAKGELGLDAYEGRPLARVPSPRGARDARALLSDAPAVLRGRCSPAASIRIAGASPTPRARAGFPPHRHGGAWPRYAASCSMNCLPKCSTDSFAPERQLPI